MFGRFAYISFWGGVEERVALLCVLSSAVAPSVAPARCCGRRPPLPVSPVGWVVRARVPSRSLSASIAPVLCCLCRPFARGCLCVCPFPLPSAHSPTRYTLPPEAGCRGHHPACGRPRVCAPTRPAASPSRILFALHVLAHSHTLALAHSHTLTLAHSHTHTLLVRHLRRPSRPAVARVVCTVRAWSRLVSSPSWLGRTARVCRPVMSCWLSLPSPLLCSSCPPSRPRSSLPYRAMAPRCPRRRRGRAGAVSGLSGPRRSSAGACTVGVARRGCVPRRPG